MRTTRPSRANQARSQTQLAPREGIIYNGDISKVSLFSFSPFPLQALPLLPNGKNGPDHPSFYRGRLFFSFLRRLLSHPETAHLMCFYNELIYTVTDVSDMIRNMAQGPVALWSHSCFSPELQMRYRFLIS